MEDTGRWQSERDYFDRQDYAAGPIRPEVIRRYTSLTKPWLPAEYPWWAMGDVAGKRVLELGCGDGLNAVILAMRGASVTAIDISPAAIAAARQKARLHRVEDRTDFIAAPLEEFRTPAGQGWDLIVCFAILHHLIPVLDSVMAQVASYCRPDTRVFFMEPVALSASLRRLRLLLPVGTRATPGERPLERPELDVIRRHFGSVEIRYFDALLRPVHRFLMRRPYEDFGLAARFGYDGLARLDWVLLNRLRLRALAGSATIVASQAGAPAAPVPDHESRNRESGTARLGPGGPQHGSRPAGMSAFSGTCDRRVPGKAHLTL